MNNHEKEDNNTLVFSYLILRRAIGLLGFTLPFILSIGAFLIFRTGMQSSLSSYYHTDMRNVFVGTLFVIGFFMLSYQGYEPKDNWAGNLGCVFAVGIALFPTDAGPVGNGGLSPTGYIHFIFAALFFLTLIYFSLVLFTKTDPEKTPTKEKRERNSVYKSCGYIMCLCLVFMAIYILLPDSVQSILNAYNPVYWLETFAILAFGISWIIKGETLLQDD
ncbi:MAG: DUF998 domain-containing protein [Candidatus Aminicenantes bacterium]|nr:DUF998 domain-containing protein [Candidatus Aminicenantes bacterium]